MRNYESHDPMPPVSSPSDSHRHRSDGRSPGLRVNANQPAFPVSQWLKWLIALRLQLRGQLRLCPVNRARRTAFPFNPNNGTVDETVFNHVAVRN